MRSVRGGEAGGGAEELFFSLHHVSQRKRLPSWCCDRSAQTRPLTWIQLQSATEGGMVDRGREGGE